MVEPDRDFAAAGPCPQCVWLIRPGPGAGDRNDSSSAPPEVERAGAVRLARGRPRRVLLRQVRTAAAGGAAFRAGVYASRVHHDARRHGPGDGTLIDVAVSVGIDGRAVVVALRSAAALPRLLATLRISRADRMSGVHSAELVGHRAGLS